MTANLGHSEQIRQRQAKINEQCKNGAQQAAPLAVPVSSPNSFPLDVFPIEAQELVSSAKIANGAPPEYVAASVLWTAATAAGNAVKLDVKPGTTETAILFMGIVGPPNAAKTPALNLALHPLHSADTKAFKDYTTKKEQAQEAAADEKKKPEHPVLDKILLNDATPEAMAAAHFNRLRGIAHHCDELAGKIKSFDRYSSGGEMDLWLSIWSAQPLTIDRKTSEPIRISRPFVSLIGGIQPARLEGMAADDRAASGFLDRFLFVWPDDLTKPDWSMKGMNSALPEKWNAAIDKLLALNMGEGENISMTESAREKLFNWFNKINKPRCIGAKNERLQGMFGKFDLHCIRLTLALHLLRFAYSGDTLPAEIDAKTVEDGIRVAEYFLTQSEKVHAQIFDTTAVDKLPRDVRQWYDRLVKSLNEKKKTITTADAVTAGNVAGLSESKAKRFLGRKDLFDKVRHGEYLPIL